jgi:hypothetical protein
MFLQIKENDIIEGPLWPEPVEIKFIENAGGYIHIVGITTLSRASVDQLVSIEEISKFSCISTNIKFPEEPWKVFLALESTRYRYASLYDPLLTMNTSKIDPLPHQIEAVYVYILKLPRIRFLIADPFITEKNKSNLRVILRKNFNWYGWFSDDAHIEDIIEVAMWGIEIDSKEYFIQCFLKKEYMHELKKQFDLIELR